MKNIKNVLVSLVIIVMFSVNSCGTEIPEKSISRHDNGGRIEVARNQTLLISLPGNPSTGYLWRVGEFDEHILQQVGKDSFEQHADTVGASGIQSFRFQPKEIGETELKLFYRRPWEKDTEPLETFVVIIVVW